MKDYRAKFFDTLNKDIISKGKKVYLYFINDYKYEKGELLVEYTRPYIKIDDRLKQIFNSIDKEQIETTLYQKYRESWFGAYSNVEREISHNGRLVLNKAAQGLFGPYFRPTRSAQSYNVYVTFYFKISEVSEIIDPNKIRRFEKVIVENETFYTIDDTAKSLISDIKASTIVNENEVIKNTITTNLIEPNDDIDEYVRIKNISLSNFINFNNTELSFSPSINLIIGKNNTGKTNLLKLLYAILKSLEVYNKQKKLYDRSYKSILSKKIQETFQSSKENIGTIVSKSNSENLKVSVDLNYLEDVEQIKFSFGKHTKKEISDVDEISELLTFDEMDFNAIFVPAKEILSIHEAIKKTFKEFIKGFDATYNDLTEIISPFIEQSGISSEFITLIENIQENIIGGKIEYDEVDKEFIYRDKKGHKFEMTMTAEGVKQVGIIPVLIKTGELHSGSIVFLDEPDNNLNPVNINKFLEILIDLVKAGVQIFISSHNYFIVKRLHIFAKQLKNIDFKVFSLIDYQDGSKIDIEQKDLKLGLPKYNPIIDEAIKMFNDDLLTDINS